MALKATVYRTPVFPSGIYLCRVDKPVSKDRTDFRDRSKTTPGIQWVFRGVKRDKNGVPSDLVCNIDGKTELVRFAMLTGDSFGSPRAALTKLLPAVFGRTLSKEEVGGIDLESAEDAFVRITVIVDTDDKGESRNKIVQIENELSGNATGNLFISEDPMDA